MRLAENIMARTIYPECVVPASWHINGPRPRVGNSRLEIMALSAKGLGATIFSRVIDNLPMSFRGQVLFRSICGGETCLAPARIVPQLNTSSHHFRTADGFGKSCSRGWPELPCHVSEGTSERIFSNLMTIFSRILA
jgi:hypothetical protein